MNVGMKDMIGRAAPALMAACCRKRLGVAILGALLMIASIGACADKTPAFYYLIDFDGVIEGEPFAFRTRVACYPQDISGGTPGRTSRVYDADRMSFGKRLPSGRGVFVGAPLYCQRIPKTEESVVPLIYITDDYDNPRHLRAFVNPAGPEPGSGVEIRKCVMRVIDPSEDAETIPILAKDMHDPFHDFDPKLWSWDVVTLLPTKTNPPLPAERRVYTSPDGRWDVFDIPDTAGMHTPLAAAGSYWAGGVVRSGPLSVVVAETLGNKLYAPVQMEDMKFAAWAYARNLRLYVDDRRLVVDPSVRGVVDAYPGMAMPWAEKTFKLVVGGGFVELPMTSLRIGHLFLYDRQTSQFFRFGRSFFGA